MVVARPWGANIPVIPVSEHNPVLSVVTRGRSSVATAETAALRPAGQPGAALLRWFVETA